MSTPGRRSVGAVVPVHGRHRHLARCLEGLLHGDRAPDRVVVVAVDDDLVRLSAALRRHLADPRVTVVHQRLGAPLAIAAARNAGAAQALATGADVLVMLDVDVVAGPGLVQAYAAACREHPDTVWSGPVTYLEQQHDRVPVADLPDHDAPHPARPTTSPGVREPLEDPDLFWSLSFALSASAWRATGGFCETYRGYGAEDTDFARLVLSAGLRLGWDGSARGYHQWHPTSDPPVQHLEAMLRNGAVYADRWGRWPMRGWLDALADQGLVVRTPDGGYAHPSGPARR
ncbi:glycosyltransferase [Nocardioidaceae bacterium]|nr:glycosyltransferase [Nocardioidaceae bacterium]